MFPGGNFHLSKFAEIVDHSCIMLLFDSDFPSPAQTPKGFGDLSQVMFIPQTAMLPVLPELPISMSRFGLGGTHRKSRYGGGMVFASPTWMLLFDWATGPSAWESLLAAQDSLHPTKLSLPPWWIVPMMFLTRMAEIPIGHFPGGDTAARWAPIFGEAQHALLPLVRGLFTTWMLGPSEAASRYRQLVPSAANSENMTENQAAAVAAFQEIAGADVITSMAQTERPEPTILRILDDASAHLWTLTYPDTNQPDLLRGLLPLARWRQTPPGPVDFPIPSSANELLTMWDTWRHTGGIGTRDMRRVGPVLPQDTRSTQNMDVAPIDLDDIEAQVWAMAPMVVMTGLAGYNEFGRGIVQVQQHESEGFEPPILRYRSQADVESEAQRGETLMLDPQIGDSIRHYDPNREVVVLIVKPTSHIIMYFGHTEGAVDVPRLPALMSPNNPPEELWDSEAASLVFDQMAQLAIHARQGFARVGRGIVFLKMAPGDVESGTINGGYIHRAPLAQDHAAQPSDVSRDMLSFIDRYDPTREALVRVETGSEGLTMRIPLVSTEEDVVAGDHDPARDGPVLTSDRHTAILRALVPEIVRSYQMAGRGLMIVTLAAGATADEPRETKYVQLAELDTDLGRQAINDDENYEYLIGRLRTYDPDREGVVMMMEQGRPAMMCSCQIDQQDFWRGKEVMPPGVAVQGYVAPHLIEEKVKIIVRATATHWRAWNMAFGPGVVVLAGLLSLRYVPLNDIPDADVWNAVQEYDPEQALLVYFLKPDGSGELRPVNLASALE